LWVAKRKPKGENLLNPAHLREKPIQKIVIAVEA
jgi:hypothetical protein